MIVLLKLKSIRDIFSQSLAESWMNLSDEERSRFVREAEKKEQVNPNPGVKIVFNFILFSGSLTRVLRYFFTTGHPRSVSSTQSAPGSYPGSPASLPAKVKPARR